MVLAGVLVAHLVHLQTLSHFVDQLETLRHRGEHVRSRDVGVVCDVCLVKDALLVDRDLTHHRLEFTHEFHVVLQVRTFFDNLEQELDPGSQQFHCIMRCRHILREDGLL